MKTKTLSPELLHKMDAYWRAANYLSVGQIYLYDNPLLKRPLTLADVKHMLLGHWSGNTMIPQPAAGHPYETPLCLLRIQRRVQPLPMITIWTLPATRGESLAVIGVTS